MTNKNTNATIVIGGALASSFTTAQRAAKGKLIELGATIRDMKREQKKIEKEMSDLSKVGKSVEHLRTRYVELGKAIEAAALKQKTLKAHQDAKAAIAERRSEARGQMFDRAGAALALGTAAIAPITLAVSRSAEFNAKLVDIGNTANLTKAQITELSAKILQTSAATNQSAESMQQAFGFLIAAGLDVGKASSSLETIGRAATATKTPIEDLAKTSFTLIDTLGVQPAGLADALDKLAATGKAGNFELNEMASYVPSLGASFKTLGMGGNNALVTMGAALQIARKGTGDASTAANNLSNFMNKIAAPDTLKKFKAAYHIDLYKVMKEAQKKGKNPFDEVMQVIIDKTKGDQKKIGEIFGDAQVQAFLRPMIQNWEEYKRIKNEAMASTGVVDTDFANVAATTRFNIDRMSNAFDRLKIAVGTQLEQSIAKVSVYITPVIDKVSQWASENSELVANVLIVGGVLGGVAAAFLGVGAAISGTVWLTTFAANGFLMLSPIMGAVGTAASFLGGKFVLLATRALPMVGQAILWVGRAMMANPIGLAATAIAAAAYLIYSNWETIGPFFDTMWQGIKRAFNAAVEWLGGVVDSFKNWRANVQEAIGFDPMWFLNPGWKLLELFWEKFSEWTGITFAGIGDSIKSAWNDLVGWAERQIQRVKGMWESTKSFFGMGGDGEAPATSTEQTPANSAFEIGATQRAANDNAPDLQAPIPGRTLQLPPTVDLKQLAGDTNVQNTETVNDQRTFTFNVTVPPGTDPKQFADQAMGQVKKQGPAAPQRKPSRAQMYDKAQGY